MACDRIYGELRAYSDVQFKFQRQYTTTQAKPKFELIQLQRPSRYEEDTQDSMSIGDPC